MNLNSVQPPLRFTVGTEHIWERLEQIPRTGWVQWEIPDPENVAEHILAIRNLAMEWRDLLGLSESEFADLLAIIEVHDWPEIVTGDIVVMGDEHNAIELRNDKRERERRAMEELCQTLPEGQTVLALYRRYEAGEDRVAQYAKELDKLQAVLLACQYHKQYNRPGLVKEFYEYSSVRVMTPVLREKLDEMIRECLD